MAKRPKPKEPIMSTDAATPPGADEDGSSNAADAVRERLVAVLDDYLKAVHAVGSAQAEKLAAPYQDYQRAVAEAQGSPDSAQRLHAAYVEQMHRIVDQLGGTEGQEAAAETRRAYATYVRQVAEALSGLPGGDGKDALPPPILAGLGQHFLFVAQLAASTGVH
jgi:transketolase